MKQILLKTWLIVVCMLLGAGTMWAEDVTGTITFGTNNVKINAASVNGNDDLGNSWTITTVGTTSFTTNAAYYQVGSSTSPATSITFTTTLPAEKTITKMSAKFGGFNSTAGKVTLKVGSTTIGTGSLNATDDVTVNSTSTASGTVLTVTLTEIAKGVKVYNISYTYQDANDTRTAVNMTGFSATETTLVKGDNTTTTVTNDQNGWTPAYTYESSNTSVATVSNAGVITAVAKGTARITATLDIANDDATWKKGATASKTIDITVNNPSHTAHFSVNGTIDPAKDASVEEGSAITFPANPEVEDVVFKGWATAAIDGTQDAAPAFVNTATENMGTNDVTYYAVFATEEEGGTQWKKVAASAVNSAGVYAIITTDGHAFNGTISSGHGQLTSTAFSFDANGVATSAPDGTCEITFAAVTGGYTMYNASNGYLYASAASSGKLAWHNTESSYWLYKSSNWLYNSNSAFLRDYQNSSIRTYGSNNGSVIQFAKKESSTTYSDYCTTVSLDPKPTIVLSATELSEYAGNTNTSITASVSEAGYTGALTVASSAEAVATASISEGTITINALTAGNATITVTAPAVTGFRKNTATIAVTVSEKLAHGLSFSADVLNLTVGDTEFSEPTLNNPNSLPVVYSLVYATPANEGKVATINAETGKLTLADPSLSTETQGAVTVKASTDGDNSHAAGEVTYNLVVARKVTTTSWSNEGAAVNIDKDEIATLPTASNDGERNLFYESSNEDVATIDNNGEVTFVAYGTTTITVKTTATAEYAATSATYELTFAPRYTVTFNVNGNETELREETTGAGVTAPAVEPIGGKVFRGWAEATIDGTTDVAPTFVTTSSLDGDKTLYAVFATPSVGDATDAEGSANFSSSVPTGWTTSGTATYFSKPVGMKAANAYIVNKNISDFKNYASSANTITIGVTSLQNGGTGSKLTVYLVDADGNTIGTGKVITPVNANDANNVTNQTVEFNAANAAGYMVKCTTYDKSILITASSYSINYNSIAYSGYCTTVASATITLNAACHDKEGVVYGTYSNASAFVVPEGLTVSTVGVDSEGKLVVNSYNTGDVVAANTGVMVSGAAGDHVVTLTNATATEAPGANNLHPSSEEMSGDNLFYRLTMHNGTQIGFWWGAENGTAFNLAANKAYLAVPNSAGSNLRLWFGDDTLTGIDAVETSTNDAIFNLQGQRINRVQKGVNIINGRKVIR